MLEYKAKGQVLSAVSKPYDFEGKSGVSHRIRVMVQGEIFACRSSQQQVEDTKKFVGQEGEVILGFSSPKESVTVEFVGFAKR